MMAFLPKVFRFIPGGCIGGGARLVLGEQGNSWFFDNPRHG